MTISASEARKNLFGLIEQVNDDQAPIEITSRKGDAVLLSAAEFRALEETAYLLRSPENAQRLFDSRQAVAEGRTIRRELDLA
jgi:antitoxin YefM